MLTYKKQLFAVALAALASACSGTSEEPAGPAGQGVAVQVTPPAPTVRTGGTVGFTASVTGTVNTSVTWTVVQAGGGTIDATGRYTAPATTGTYTVRATSVADPLAAGEAAVTVQAPVAVTISPRTPSVVAGGTIAFTATVANSTNAAVTWSVPGTGCGTITQAGVYSAPATARTCSVVSTSQADPTKSDTATVTVTAAPLPVAIAVTPSPAAVDACKTLTFTATVTNTTNRAATWTIQEGAAGGTITSGGVYTAPASAGTYHVVGTSVADPTKSAIATVTVTERVLSVAVNPPTASVQTGGAVQFTATVTTTCGAFVSAATVP